MIVLPWYLCVWNALRVLQRCMLLAVIAADALACMQAATGSTSCVHACVRLLSRMRQIPSPYAPYTAFRLRCPSCSACRRVVGMVLCGLNFHTAHTLASVAARRGRAAHAGVKDHMGGLHGLLSSDGSASTQLHAAHRQAVRDSLCMHACLHAARRTGPCLTYIFWGDFNEPQTCHLGELGARHTWACYYT